MIKFIILVFLIVIVYTSMQLISFKLRNIKRLVLSFLK
jgi:hypothetical protein